MSATGESGTEWVVDASGCRAEALRDTVVLRDLLDAIVRDLALRPCAEPLWKTFDGGGLTAMVLLAESHLTVHTYPEHGYAAFNLYCCAPRAPWDWERALAATLGAERIAVRVLNRPALRSPTRTEP
jgi:S-adenosylmethionine decarboxylase